MNYLRKVKDPKVISIYQSRKLQAKDVALPTGIIPTDEQWEEYLDRKQGKGELGIKAIKDIKNRLRAKYGK